MLPVPTRPPTKPNPLRCSLFCTYLRTVLQYVPYLPALRVPPDLYRQRDPPSRPLPLRAKLGTFCACAPTPPSSRSLYHIASPALWSVWALPDQKPSTSTFWRRPRPLLFFIPTSLNHKTFTNYSLFDNDASQGSLKATRPPIAGSLSFSTQG